MHKHCTILNNAFAPLDRECTLVHSVRLGRARSLHHLNTGSISHPNAPYLDLTLTIVRAFANKYILLHIIYIQAMR